jgi:hypothetical protein
VVRVLRYDPNFLETSGLTISLNFMVVTARPEFIDGAVQSVIDRGIDYCWA